MNKKKPKFKIGDKVWFAGPAHSQIGEIVGGIKGVNGWEYAIKNPGRGNPDYLVEINEIDIYKY